MTRSGVQRLYARAGGRWWDLFRSVWEPTTARAAVRDLCSLLAEYLTEHSRILDLGCGPGTNLGRILDRTLPFNRYVGMDFSPSMLALAEKKFGDVKNVSFLEVDAMALRDDGDRYDLIVSTWLLDHLDEAAEVVNNARRLLAPGGHLVMLYYGYPRWYVAFWQIPSGWLLRAAPVSNEEVSRFQGVLTKRRYRAGAVVLVDIEAPAP